MYIEYYLHLDKYIAYCTSTVQAII